MKYISLVVLTIQNAMLGLSMRYARTRPGDMFLSSTAVIMSEVVKFVICVFVVYKEEGSSVSQLVHTLNTKVVKQPLDTLKVCVPSFLYVIQNNLLYVSASNLDAATNQVTYQLKILTTALFSVLMLKRQLLISQWISLIILIFGVVCVQLADTEVAVPSHVEQNRLMGFSAALGACVLSGYAGIFFEKVLKSSDISVWLRNVQLSVLSLPLGLLTTMVSDYRVIREKGFFFGYDGFVIYVIILQAVGGFATSLAIVISCIASIYLFNFVLSFQFVMGVVLVISSIFAYNYRPPDIQKVPV
ncbi:UNVERIFIED_CONTAM: hypothetical protein PYX00_010178 [Menopon gallinae]|uniref:UDP-N-acetylglucosamine transporter n=1 Tax=Menopon gallinae TaxID=328185 RepID=A0AAW2HE92_9NEOP